MLRIARYNRAMNFIRITFNGLGGGTYSYDGYYVPCIGTEVDFPFVGPPMVGVVSAIKMIHTNEVIVTVSAKGQ
jgi:hypothetical protein